MTPSLCMYRIIKLGQSITDRNSEAVNTKAIYSDNLTILWDFLLITFILVKRIVINFFLRSHFFGLLVTLKFSDYWLRYLFWLLVKLMQHIRFGVYQTQTRHISRANLSVQEWNSAPRFIQICRIQWCCSLFSFLTENTLFGQI